MVQLQSHSLKRHGQKLLRKPGLPRPAHNQKSGQLRSSIYSCHTCLKGCLISHERRAMLSKTPAWCNHCWLVICWSAVQKFGVSLLSEGQNLIGLVLAATDAEKDPRCLMLAFSCCKLLGTVYAAAGRQADLQVGMSCFSPITPGEICQSPKNVYGAIVGWNSALTYGYGIAS